MTIDSWQQTVPDIERMIISSCIREPMKNGVYAGELTPEKFTDPRHQVIYRTILELFTEMDPVDGIILKNRLIKNAQLDESGGEEYLNELIKLESTGLDFRYYVGMITENGFRQRMKQTGLSIAARSENMSISIHDTWQMGVDELFAIKNDSDKQGVVGFDKLVEDMLFKTLQYRTHGSLEKGVTTGYKDLDRKLNGFMPGDLVVIAARPAMGKSALMMSMLHHICGERRKPVGMVTLEASREAVTQRLLSQKSGIQFNKIRTGEIIEEEWQRLALKGGEINSYPLYILDPPFGTPAFIRMQALKLVREFGIEVLFIDYLQMMKSHRKNHKNRELEVAEICRSLKSIARELKIPVVVTSQLSRAVETRGGDKKPILSDLRESGAIEQEADKVLFIYRGEYYGLEIDWEGNPTKNVAEIIIAKNRTGPVGSASLRYMPRLSLFIDPEAYVEKEMDEDILNENKLINKHHKLFNDDADRSKRQFNVPF